MQIKRILSILLIMLLPIGIMARDSKDFERACDAIVFNEAYEKFHDVVKPKSFTYVLGEKDNRLKYKDELLKFCNENKCDRAKFAGMTIFEKRALDLNMPSFLLYLNNIKLLEILLSEHPEMKVLMDDGTYPDITWCNGEFITPALNAVKEGQIGILKYLVDKYNVNLFKIAGYKYYNKNKPQHPLTVVEIADEAIARWRYETPNSARLECAVKMKEYVEEWKNSHKYMEAQAKDYNNKVENFASTPKYIMSDIIQFEFIPVNTLDLFRLQNMEGNYSQSFKQQYVEKRVSALIEKVMHNLELEFNSADFGNQV